MPRKLRLEYPGAMYHIMSRGDQRDDIFLDDVDRHDFVRTLAEGLPRLRWTQDDLAARRKSDPAKLALAARLRQETTLSVKQTAQRMGLGKPKGARTNLHKFMNRSETGSRQTPSALR